jgi:hypothetical protein
LFVGGDSSDAETRCRSSDERCWERRIKEEVFGVLLIAAFLPHIYLRTFNSSSSTKEKRKKKKKVKVCVESKH